MEFTENWSKREALSLIESYKKYPLLYTTSHAEYLNRHKKQEAFDQITQEMQVIKPTVTCSQVKSKIKALHRQLAVERQRLINFIARGKSADAFEWTLWCFNELKFILKANENSLTQELSSNLSKKNDEKKIPFNKRSSTSLESSAYKNLKRGREVTSLEILHNCAKTSVNLMSTLLEKSQKKKTKEELFCSLLCEELKEIKNVETYDFVTAQILNIVRKAKAKERQLLERQQLIQEITSNNSTAAWDESFSSAEDYANQNGQNPHCLLKGFINN